MVYETLLIPVHNALGAFRRCVSSLRRSVWIPNVHIYDDGSDPPTARAAKESAVGLGGWHLRNAEPRGYAHSINTAALWSIHRKERYLIVCNSDLMFARYALDRLVDQLRSSDAAFAGPALSAAGSGQGGDDEIMAVGPDQEELDRIEKDRASCRPEPIDRVNGACMAIKARYFLEYGFFDERFGLGSAEEEEWMSRFPPGSGLYVPSSVVWHQKHASFDEADVDSEELWRKNNAEMKRKTEGGEDWARLTYPREWPREMAG